MRTGVYSNHNNKKLSDSDLAFLRDPANREFADSLDVIDKGYLFPEAGTAGFFSNSGLSKEELSDVTSQILGQRSKIQGQKIFGAPGSRGGVSDFQPIFGFAPPSQYSGQVTGANYFSNNPVINQGFNQPQLNQPQLNPQLLGQMGIGASSAPQNSMLSNLATRGMQQMSAGQTMNPTLGKATS
tara:strand:+ start:4724 stop:5275 length:552 start_codon:yes stop_codon:yes gene_type:complete